MQSSDYRRIARENLAGKWGISILAALIAGLLGGLVTGSGLSFEIDLENDSVSQVIYELPAFIQYLIVWMVGVVSMLSLVNFIVGGVIRQGYCQFLLKQHDGQEGELNDLFSQFHRFGDGFCLSFLQSLFIFLWSLLFVIPGIIASFSYAMAPFIMLEHPDMKASDAIKASKEMMYGRKADLFFLSLSFLGWSILSVFTLGIGTLWLNPYMNAAYAAFYRDISRMPTME